MIKISQNKYGLFFLYYPNTCLRTVKMKLIFQEFEGLFPVDGEKNTETCPGIEKKYNNPYPTDQDLFFRDI